LKIKVKGWKSRKRKSEVKASLVPTTEPGHPGADLTLLSYRASHNDTGSLETSPVIMRPQNRYQEKREFAS